MFLKKCNYVHVVNNVDVVHASRKNKTMTQIQLKLQKFSN